MNKRTSLTNKNGDIRTLKRADFAAMQPATKVLPDIVEAWEKERAKRHATLTSSTNASKS